MPPKCVLLPHCEGVLVHQKIEGSYHILKWCYAVSVSVDQGYKEVKASSIYLCKCLFRTPRPRVSLCGLCLLSLKPRSKVLVREIVTKKISTRGMFADNLKMCRVCLCVSHLQITRACKGKSKHSMKSPVHSVCMYPQTLPSRSCGAQ